jgi:hypothetical protein
VGVIQTVIDDDAWSGSQWTMSPQAGTDTWSAISRAFQQFHVLSDPPDIVVLPELSVPHWRLSELKRMTAGLPCITIAGMDFDQRKEGVVANEAVILLPYRWPEERPSGGCKMLKVGKTYPSDDELELLKKKKPKQKYASDPALWLFDAGCLGRFAVCLCFDFMDVDRLPLYRGEIQHLFVLAHNRDIATFNHLAEGLCRTLYCNVVVCNTGYYGSSLAMTPYAKHYRRPTYRIQGQRLETAQIVTLPTRSVADAQDGRGTKLEDEHDALKALPPGLPASRRTQLGWKDERL